MYIKKNAFAKTFCMLYTLAPTNKQFVVLTPKPPWKISPKSKKTNHKTENQTWTVQSTKKAVYVPIYCTGVVSLLHLRANDAVLHTIRSTAEPQHFTGMLWTCRESQQVTTGTAGVKKNEKYVIHLQ